MGGAVRAGFPFTTPNYLPFVQYHRCSRCAPAMRAEPGLSAASRIYKRKTLRWEKRLAALSLQNSTEFLCQMRLTKWERTYLDLLKRDSPCKNHWRDIFRTGLCRKDFVLKTCTAARKGTL